MGQCVTRPVQPKPRGRRVEKSLVKKPLPMKFERALTFREKYGGSEVLTTDDFHCLDRMPETLNHRNGDSGGFDSVQNSPDSASTGMETSRRVLTVLGDALQRERPFPIYPLKPQTPFLEDESDCLSDITDIQQEMVASKKDRGDSWPLPDAEQGSDPVDNIDVWEFKEKLLERINGVLQKKEGQVALINREQRSRVPGTRPAFVPRTAKRPVPETTRNLRSVREVEKQHAKRAATLPIARTAAETQQKLTSSHSWSSTRDFGPKAGEDNKVVQAETLELPQMDLQFDSDAMIPEEPDSTSLGSDSASKDSRLVVNLPKISSDNVWKMEGGELGRGVSGSVCLCYWNGVEVAVKEWHGLFNQLNQSSMLQEADTLGTLRHPCVVQLFGITSMGGSPATVMEYVLHGSLQNKLRELRAQGGITSDLKSAIALRIAHGMYFLHSQNIIHFDLKAANLLCDLRDPERPVVKIADVGLSKLKLDTYVSGNMRGTLPWMAPELFPSLDSMPGAQGVIIDKVDEKVDVYSFAIVLWEIWSLGEDPYQGLSTADLLYGLMSKTLRPEIPPDCEPFWGNLMMRCWQHEPSQRPSFEEITRELDVNLLDRDLTLV